MKKSRFTDSQIIAILKQAESGTPVPELCREQRHLLRHVLQVALKIRRHGHLDDVPDEGARRREPAPEKMYAESQLSADITQGGARKKMVRHLLSARPARWQMGVFHRKSVNRLKTKG